MEPRVAAQLEAEKTYAEFIAWSKTAPAKCSCEDNTVISALCCFNL